VLANPALRPRGRPGDRLRRHRFPVYLAGAVTPPGGTPYLVGAGLGFGVGVDPGLGTSFGPRWPRIGIFWPIRMM